MTFDTAPFLATCVSIDLEVDPKSARLFAFAAVRGEAVLVHKGAALDPALDRLEALCDGAAHLVGHNILRHDLPHLVANRARLAGLGAAPIDTLWLNPLAFPRNPYHHLVKHYQDGRLQVGHVNDPEQDARLALQVLSDQIAAFTRLGQEAPDAVLAYHHLTTRGEASAGFDALFRFLRGPAPDEATVHTAIRRLLGDRACNHRLEQTLGRLSDPRNGWPMAYALSWISVAGGDSVMPPWVTVLTDGPHAFVQPGDAILSRRITPDTASLPRARLRYVPPDPKLVDLSFAGRLRPGDPSLAVIAAASPGEPVQLIRDGDRWRIDNAQGQTLARLSRAFAPPEGTTFLRGEVAAILNWRREDGNEEYNHLLRRDEWEVVLPELVFEAGAQAVMADLNGS